MHYLGQLWTYISTQGIKPEHTPLQVRDITHVNHAAVVACLITFFATFLNKLILPQSQIYLVILASGLSYLLAIVLNRFQQYQIAKCVTIFVGDIATFWAASLIGYDAGIHHVYIVLIFATMVNMKPYNSLLFFIMISIPIALLGLLFLTEFSLFKSNAFSQEQIKSINIFMLIINIITALLATYFFVRDNDKSSQVLENTANELSEKYGELQKLNKELDRFVYSVSHDLRAPIASSLGLTALMKSEADLQTIYQYAQLQEKSLKKLDFFIKDILDYSRNRRQELEIKQVDLQRLINEILEMQSFQPHYESIKKVIEINANAPFWTDEKRISVILNNLISNALRYHNPRREKPFVQINAQIAEKEVIITIKDNGIGIQHEYLPKIFEMFYRATDSANGSGLGLYIVKETLDKMQGKIEVQSTYGEGTTFLLHLPNTKSESAE